MRFFSLAALQRELPGVPVVGCAAAALALHVLTAWLHAGFYHPDEHYQILEFAWARLGHAPMASLPWEYAERMRPALQPALAAALVRAFESVGRFDPFVVAFLLRLASAVLGLWVTLAVCARTLPSLRHDRLKRFAFLGSVFFWLAAAAHARFSAENWGGIFLFAGLCAMLDALEAERLDPRRAARLAAAAGAAWALAFYCRFQVGFALAGVAGWLVFVRRTSFRALANTAFAALLVVAANVCLDRWFYGQWVLSPLNYVHANVLEDRASAFGTSPAWATLMPFVLALGPPVSIGFILAVAAGCWYARREPLIWTILPFVVAHAMVPHKEARFMAPVVYGLVPLVAVSLASLPAAVLEPLSRWRQRWPGRASAWLMWTANAAALVVVTATPIDDKARTLEWLWRESRSTPLTLFSLNGAPYDDLLPLNFYHPSTVRVLPLYRLGRTQPGPAGTRQLALYEGLGPLHLVPPVPVDCRPVMDDLLRWRAPIERRGLLPARPVHSICEAVPIDSAPR